MTIKLDGTGYLICSSRILSALPIAIIGFGTRSVSSGDQTWVMQSQSNGDRRVSMYLTGSSENKGGQHRSPAASGTTQKTTAPNVSATVMQLFGFQVPDAATRGVLFGDSSVATNTIASGSPVDDLVNHNQVIIGASQSNNGTFANFMKGEIAEVHFFSAVPTAAQYDAMIAGTLKPEEVTGWVDGLPLKDFQPSGTYTSMQGRTFTAVGGVTAGTINWNLYGRTTQPVPTTVNGIVGNAAAAGQPAAVAFSGSAVVPALIGNAAAGGSTASVATLIVSDIIINNTGTVRANQAVVYSWFPGGRIGSLAGITASEGTGTTGANGRLIPGIPLAAGVLMIAYRNAGATTDDVYYQAF